MISVVIPVYNSESTIERVLLSVLNQTRVDLIKEIIVVDDGSIDNSATIVKKISYQYALIRYHYQVNKGASAARNYGITLSSGKYVAFLDSDDIWLPNKIERQWECITNNPEIVFLGCNCSDNPLFIGLKKIDKLYNASIKDLCIKSFPVTPSVIIRKDAIDDIGLFDENQKFSEDINYFQKFCIKYNYYYLPEKLVQIGIQKSHFGESGLSSNTKGMHQGELKNLLELKNVNAISISFYYTMRVFYAFKYSIRLIRNFYRSHIN